MTLVCEFLHFQQIKYFGDLGDRKSKQTVLGSFLSGSFYTLLALPQKVS